MWEGRFLGPQHAVRFRHYSVVAVTLYQESTDMLDMKERFELALHAQEEYAAWSRRLSDRRMTRFLGAALVELLHLPEDALMIMQSSAQIQFWAERNSLPDNDFPGKVRLFYLVANKGLERMHRIVQEASDFTDFIAAFTLGLNICVPADLALDFALTSRLMRLAPGSRVGNGAPNPSGFRSQAHEFCEEHIDRRLPQQQEREELREQT